MMMLLILLIPHTVALDVVASVDHHASVQLPSTKENDPPPH
jgi:hypothetical protein